MKRLLFFITIAIAIVNACSPEEFSSENTIYTVSAALESDDATRACLAADGGVFRMFWEENDRISILSGKDNIPFGLVSGAGSAKGTFRSDAGVPAGIAYAVYPYSADASLSGSVVTLTYPSELEYDAAEHLAKGGEYMIGKSSDASFEFKNIHSYLNLSFTAAKEDFITSIEIASFDNSVVSGPATVDFSGSVPEVTMTGSGRSVTVNMNSAAIGPDKPLRISVPVAPVYLGGITVTVHGSSGWVRVFSSSSVSIGRNQIVDMNEAPVSKPAEAAFNSVEYEKLTDALTAASWYDNSVVTLLSDVFSPEIVTVSGSHSITLDLAGRCLQVRSLISRGDDVTLTDSSPEGTGTLSSTSTRTLQVEAGEFTIAAGSIVSRDSSAVFVSGNSRNAPRVIFNGGTITSEKAPNIVWVRENATFDMHGGQIVAKGGNALHARSLTDGLYSTINVDGGSITGSAAHIFYAYTRARITVSGGFFQTDNGNVVHNGTSNAAVRMRVTGGFFHAVGYPSGRYIGGYNAASIGNIHVTGGCFNVDPVAQSTAAASNVAFTVAAPYVVNNLSSPQWVNGYIFPYEVVRGFDGIVVGYSFNGTSQTTKNAFTTAFQDAGAQICFFDDYVSTDEQAEEYLRNVDALVIPGSATSDASNRSSSDRALIRAAISQGKPVLGVCYGHQRICLVKGGSVPSVASAFPNTTIVHKEVIDGVNSVRSKELHPITIDKSSVLYSLLGTETIMVNSSHNYCCKISNGNLKIVAKAPDGCCEALESTIPGECLLGVQFHPEYLYSAMGRTQFLAIFKYIVDKAEEMRERK